MDFEKPQYEDGVADWGFTNPDPGWYLMEIMDNSEEKTKEDGKTVLRIPLKIVEGDFTGAQQSFFITIAGHVSDKEAGFAKKKIADIISVTGMWDLFEKNFPGQTSLLDPRVISAVRTKLAGRGLKVLLEESKPNKEGNTFINVRKLAPANYVPPADGKPAAKAGKPAPKPKANDPAPGPNVEPAGWE